MITGVNQVSQRIELGRAAHGDATKASVKNRMTFRSGALPYIGPGASLWYILSIYYTVYSIQYILYSIYQRPVYTGRIL